MKRHLTEQELIEHKFKLASEQQAEGYAEHLAGCAECRERLELLDQKFAALDLLREDVSASDDLISQAIAQAKQPVRRKIIPFGKYHWVGTAAAVLVVGLTLLIGNFDKQRSVTTKISEAPKSEGAGLQDRSGAPSEEAEKKEVTLVAKDLDDKIGAQLDEAISSRPVATRSAPAPSMKGADSPTDKLGTNSTTGLDNQSNFAFAPSSRQSPAPNINDESTKLLSDEKQDQNLLQRTNVARAEAAQDAKLSAGTARSMNIAEISEKPPFAPASAIELVTLPRRDSVQLTIYNSADLTLVREKRNLTLKQGWNWLQLMWANTLIDPTSLSLEPAAQGDKIDVQQLVFPARLRELGRWLIRSEISGQVPFEITYFTSGLSWRAFYMGTLSQDEKKMRLQGYVRVANNSGENYENAQTRLLVGKVNLIDKIADLAKRQYAYGRPGVRADLDDDERLGEKADKYSKLKYNFSIPAIELNGAFDAFNLLKPKEIKKEGLSEYFLYTIEGTETIADKWSKRLASFDIEDIDVESLYKYDEERWGNNTIRFVSFANDDEHNLGQTPIPDGIVKIYGHAGDQGNLSYVGEAYTKYIPVGEEVELNLNVARLVKVEPKLMEFRTDNYVFDSNDNVAGWDEIRTWQVEITNARAIPIEIEITRGFGTPYWKLVVVDLASTGEDAISYSKHDVMHARFTLKRRPSSKYMFSYTVTTYHGKREEQVNQ